MQIHEVSKRTAPPPVQGLDTTKVSPHIAAQIAKAEADSQARLSQQAKQAAPANPFGSMASSLQSPPTPAGPIPTSTGGTATRTATGTTNRAGPSNPNVKAQPKLTTAAPPLAPRNTAAPSLSDKTKAMGNATAAGWKKGGLLGALKNNLSWDPYNTELDKIANPAATVSAPDTPQATLIAKLAPTGLTQKGLAAAGQVLQQLSNGNKTIKKTGDRNVDAVLSSMGYTLQ